MRILIIGGVAGGATAAARLARLDSNNQIIVFERGDNISYGNCGLPYHIGKVIKDRNDLLLTTPESFRARYNVDVRVRHEVISIDRANKNIEIRNLDTSCVYRESYDKLIIATGASPLRLNIPGADLDGVAPLWTLRDMDRIKGICDSGIQNAVISGGGYVGVETAENLALRGIKTYIIQRSGQLLAPFDPEMAQIAADELRRNGVEIYFDCTISEIKKTDKGQLRVILSEGTVIDAGIVITSGGIKFNSELAANAGLDIGKRGSIQVNPHLQTSDRNIYAVGDVIEVRDMISGDPASYALAGPANRQARIAADNIMGGSEVYRGSLGTNICQVFKWSFASAGLNEKQLKALQREYLKTYLMPNSHASYYPGAEMLYIKLIFDNSGIILGAQVAGRGGVDKTIDVLATAMRNKLTVADLEELELAYAPPYSSAKSPINMAGFVANNIIKGDSRVVFADSLPKNAFLLDVREEGEFARGCLQKAVNIPLGKLRSRMGELPRESEIVVYCKSGMRGYVAERLLRDNGFKVSNLNGGYLCWKMFNPQ